jgi:uncharacterized protein YbaP (TraB family)
LRSTDRVLIESIRLALESDTIDVVLDQGSNSALPFIPVTIYVSEENFEAAERILRDLGAPAPVVSQHHPWSDRTLRVLLIVVGILAIFVCGIMIG